MPLTLSAAFPPGRDTPDHVALAERLGYARAWLYDSPALYHDVWMSLARCAERTDTIGLGPAVLVPSLRHPMVTAAAVATLADLAPDRVAVALGAGFTGRHVLGQRAMRWDDVRAYVVALRALLRGEEAMWEGRPIRMIHPAGFGAARPIEVPILLGADGPRGTVVARELADGMFSAGLPNPEADGWHALLQFGTVLDEGEAPDAPGSSRPQARRWRWRCTASTSAAARPRSTACRAGPSGGPRSRSFRPSGATSPPTRDTSSSSATATALRWPRGRRR